MGHKAFRVSLIKVLVEGYCYVAPKPFPIKLRIANVGTPKDHTTFRDPDVNQWNEKLTRTELVLERFALMIRMGAGCSTEETGSGFTFVGSFEPLAADGVVREQPQREPGARADDWRWQLEPR